ncbi:hypothetical protein [Haliscomenobacter sp.]|uniref:hypothetical protein n=1 Tax=Haliscomenobacter sp. TaxID=2717303 RepID=UPI0035940053
MPKTGILQIAYYFPPIKTVGTLRNARFAHSAKNHWSKVYVLSTSHTQVFDVETGQPIDAIILRVPSYDFRWLLWLLRRKKATHFSPQLKKQAGISWIRRAIDSFPLNIILGDGGFFYLLIGYWSAAALIKKGEISHLYSSFRPMSDHFLAYLLHRRFPFLIWIADFRDVPVDPLLKNVWWPGFQDWILRKLLRRASFLTTVSEGLAQYLRTTYQRPVQVMHNAPLLQQSDEVQIQDFEQFTIVYTGSLYPQQQNAGPLFLALKALLDGELLPTAQLRLLVCGKDGALWQSWAAAYGLANILEDRGMLSHAEALSLQHSAQVNLLLSWNSPKLGGILTSKVFEYLQAQRPILAIVNGSPDPELETLISTSSPVSLVLYPDQDFTALKRFLQTAYLNWQQGKKSYLSLPATPSWENEMERVFGDV